MSESSSAHIPPRRDAFDSQTYPTVEQTIAHDSSMLYRQKKHFLKELRHLLGLTGYVIIAIIYLRDLSMSLFLMKTFLQFVLTKPIPEPLPSYISQAEARKQNGNFTIILIILSAVISLGVHILQGPYNSETLLDRQLHGGITMQFIGERVAYTRVELVLLDLFLTAMQLYYHALQFNTDDLQVLSPVRANPLPESDSEEPIPPQDGFNGNIMLVTLDAWDSLCASLRYRKPPPNVEAQRQWWSSQATEMRHMFV